VTETERTAGTTAVHPLDPLTAEEITAAARIIRAHEGFGKGHRFVSIALHEPPKEEVLAFRSGNGPEREAFAVLLDRSDGATYEASRWRMGWSPTPTCCRSPGPRPASSNGPAS
jgi:primary-amine oxidase